jgi:hypothetical protein
MPRSALPIRVIGWPLVAAACLAPAAFAAAPPIAKRAPARVGQVFIVGNERTRMDVILRQVPLSPGQVLDYPALKKAEQNLARLNVFETSPDGSVRPTVTVLDNPLDPDSPHKDVLISVRETSTFSLKVRVEASGQGGLFDGQRQLFASQKDMLSLLEQVSAARRLPFAGRDHARTTACVKIGGGAIPRGGCRRGKRWGGNAAQPRRPRTPSPCDAPGAPARPHDRPPVQAPGGAA